MIRVLVFLLVLGNIVIFALSAGGQNTTGSPALTDQSAAHAALSPDRIRIVSRGEAPPVPEQPKVCQEWRELSESQVATFESLVSDQGELVLNRSETRNAKTTYWVFIPSPNGGKPAAERKASELKALGIKNYQLVEEGANDRWTVSLGVYDNETAAEAALAGFKKSGVRSARSGVKTDTPSAFRVRLIGTKRALTPATKLPGMPAPLDCPPEALGATKASPPALAKVNPAVVEPRS